MPFDLEDLRTNLTAEVDGTWIPIKDDCRLLIARWNNTKFKQAFENAKATLRATGTSVAGDEDSEDVNDSIIKACVAEHILKGFEGLTQDGVMLQYSKAEALRIFKEIPDFYKLIIALSQKVENFRVKRLKN